MDMKKARNHFGKKKLSSCGLELCCDCEYRFGFGCLVNVSIEIFYSNTIFVKLTSAIEVVDFEFEKLSTFKCMKQIHGDINYDIDRTKVRNMMGCDNNGMVKAEDWRF